MPRYEFDFIDAHTCGNPVRLVRAGAPQLQGANMSEKRLHFLREFDWIRTGLMFEPRGHDLMSGSILYPPHDPANDIAVLFIETSGCLPMCGHGLIGTVTIAIQERLLEPAMPGTLRIETPAGLVVVRYQENNGGVRWVRFTNVPSFLHSANLVVDCPGLGEIEVDVAYGGNFYAIVDVQERFPGIEYFPAGQLITMARDLRKALNERYSFVHPGDANISGCSHVLWSGAVLDPESTARNAVVYGEKAIDRSPCGTGTSARMAQWHSRGKLRQGETFVHESIIGTKFVGRIEEELEVFEKKAIRPSIEGWAKIYGRNRIWIDTDDDPFAQGFQVI